MFFQVTLTTYESDRPCSTSIYVEANSAEEADRIAEYERDFGDMEWSDNLGNIVLWEEVDGPVTVAWGTEKIV